MAKRIANKISTGKIIIKIPSIKKVKTNLLSYLYKITKIAQKLNLLKISFL